ncbi:MAG: alpha/beta hydrolase [Gemmatimonadota bacterium]
MRWLVWSALGALLGGGAGSQLPAQASQRGTVTTLSFWSQMLGTRKSAKVWLPAAYDGEPNRRFPVAVYLHGIGGTETDWIEQGALDRTLDSLTAAGMPPMIVVMPDGDDGFYTTWNWLGDYAACRRNFTPRPPETADTFCVPWPKYDDYIARDLVQFVDTTLRTISNRSGRAIAGLSMGGYGAITLALNYPDVFSAAASHSGVLSPLLVTNDSQFTYAAEMRELREKWGERWYPRLTPIFGEDTAAWWARDPARRARRLLDREAPVPALMADVGVDDPFLGQNRAFRSEMTRLGTLLRYSEAPGSHDWEYWRRQSVHSLLWIADKLRAASRN